ncbi:hypothetical protein CAC42_7316 [Sphaceloma murrayae]|uniref:Uncharacterized protein n=1 Tax=Sphaceloma murrayae TaxID=2082308 RepID=A0A2K1QWP6_9PEZI|nr:hypothetical protein CAC42_7316 [Sphaceloma murrayae]
MALEFTPEPMDNPTTEAWGLQISDDDFEKLKGGWEPEQMEDKWMIVSQPSGKDRIAVNIARSWTHEIFFLLTILPPKSGEGAKIESILWETKNGHQRESKENAIKEAVMLCKGMLGVKFESLGA